MLMKHKAFSLLYLLFFLFLLAVAFSQNAALYQVIRPCVLLSLSIYFFFTTRLKGRFHKRLFTGLVLATIADFLIVNQAQTGAYAFAAYCLAAIYYIRAFYLDFRSAQELDKRGARIGIVACTILGMGCYSYIRPHLNGDVFPAMVSTFLTSMLLMMAIFRNLRVNIISFNLITAGTACLALTVFLFALNKYMESSEITALLMLSTYVVGQYLVVIGGIERKLLNQDTI